MVTPGKTVSNLNLKGPERTKENIGNWSLAIRTQKGNPTDPNSKGNQKEQSAIGVLRYDKKKLISIFLREENRLD